MKNERKYDPEDIESLLLHKQFNELYPEEKEFVLRYIDGPDEYESMRKTLFDVMDASHNGEWMEPDASLKQELLNEFNREKKSRFVVWLNSFFLFPEVRWYRQPVLQFAVVSVLVAGVTFFLLKGNEQKDLLSEVKQESPDTANVNSELPKDTIKDLLIAENKLPPIPEAPLTVTETLRNISEVSEETIAGKPQPLAANSATDVGDRQDLSSISTGQETSVKKESASVDDVSVADSFSSPAEQPEEESVVQTLQEKTVAAASSKVTKLAVIDSKAISASAPARDNQNLIGLLFTAK